MVVFSVAFWDIMSRFRTTIMIPIKFMLMNKTTFENTCLISSIVHQNIKKMKVSFCPTCGQLPPTSGSADWHTLDPHMGIGIPN